MQLLWNRTWRASKILAPALVLAVLADPASARDTVIYGQLQVPNQIFIGIEKGYFEEEDLDI